MLVLVIDGMGGGIGAQLVSQLSGQVAAGVEVVCVGTNAWATQSMVKGGAAGYVAFQSTPVIADGRS